MKKNIIIGLLAGIILCIPVKTYANVNIKNTYEETIEMPIKKAQSVVWKYRKHNGRWQKRLWNKTKKIWLTNWIYVE